MISTQRCISCLFNVLNIRIVKLLCRPDIGLNGLRKDILFVCYCFVKFFSMSKASIACFEQYYNAFVIYSKPRQMIHTHSHQFTLKVA